MGANSFRSRLHVGLKFYFNFNQIKKLRYLKLFILLGPNLC